MKLLFDQNLSCKLINKLSDIFPDSSHVTFHDLSFENDLVIRNFALHHDFTIVTQDLDFYDLAMLMDLLQR
jgi:predicted nuclease of predicted toxin-antitoxin system